MNKFASCIVFYGTIHKAPPGLNSGRGFCADKAKCCIYRVEFCCKLVLEMKIVDSTIGRGLCFDFVCSSKCTDCTCLNLLSRIKRPNQGNN